MSATRRRAALLLAAATALSTGAGPATGESSSAASPRPPLDDAGKERFLREGRIVRSRDAGGGVTPSKRVTLSLDGVEHGAHVQAIDDARAMAVLDGGPPELDFRDSYKGNVVAYRLDRLLGLGMVPVSVVRPYDGRNAAYTWWVDDVVMDERERERRGVPPPDASRWSREVGAVRIFDQLIYNTDRNPGNLLIDRSWRLWMIDHTRAFKIFKTLPHEDQLGRRCARALLDSLRRLDEEALRATMGDLLTAGQVEGLLARRDRVVAHYDARIAELGEAVVLYDLPPRAGGEALPP